MCLQAQGAGPSIAQAMTSTSSYSKKVEIFNNPGEYNGLKAKFKEWWDKIQVWLMVNQHMIPAGSQYTIDAVLFHLKGPKVGPFAQVHLMQVAQENYSWDQMVSNIEELFYTTNKKDWTRKELCELKQEKILTDDFIVKWEALYLQADINNSYMVELLERNTMPGTITRIFQEGKCYDSLFSLLLYICFSFMSYLVSCSSPINYFSFLDSALILATLEQSVLS